MACGRYKNGGMGAYIKGFLTTSLSQVMLADNVESGAQVLPADASGNSSVMLEGAIIAAPTRESNNPQMQYGYLGEAAGGSNTPGSAGDVGW